MATLNPAQVTQVVGTKYYNLATLVVILYDHSLTFDTEVEKIWSQNRSLPKSLWFVFRYITPIIQITAIMADQLTTWTHGSCVGWLWFRFVADEIVTVATSAILILRIWALFERARWIMFVMLAALLGQIVVTVWAWQAATAAPIVPSRESPHSELTGCFPVPKSSDRSGQVASLFISLLVLDTVLFLLTILRAFRLPANRAPSVPVLSIMLRDGVLYLIMIFVVNLANVLLIQLPGVPLGLKALNTEFTPNVTVIMVSRLVLNLRAAEKSTATNLESTVLSNLGEPVQFKHAKLEIQVTTDQVTYVDDDQSRNTIALEELQGYNLNMLPI
ncbi:hypothetical protein JB92DRAFT_3091912 [Gautieria morchelliformis]|nr:hypothetical protein JB92DRAFT_3091912 [Gautieria morchelliformis]